MRFAARLQLTDVTETLHLKNVHRAFIKNLVNEVIATMFM